MLEHLQPQRVFYYFEKLCGIPHGSGNTKQISDFCVDFAKEHNLEYYQDADNNVIIIKEATKGYEAADAVIIQGHLDMVCAKTADCTKDMEAEGLDIYIDGEEIRAKDTTLGADNGIAVAMALAILESEDIEHPRIEAVFTVDEEIGLLGAASLDVSPLKATMLINLDSEDEGVFTVSCAGGNVAICSLPIQREDYTGTICELEITGCKGGHSGIEIDKGRSNPNMLMGRLLQDIRMHAKIQLVLVEGGLKDNAIPVQSKAVVTCKDEETLSQIAHSVEEMGKIFMCEFASTDPDIMVEFTTKTVESTQVMNVESTESVICQLTSVPNGVQVMSADIDGLVQTSLNLGIVKTQHENVQLSFGVRSSVDSEKEMINNKLCTVTEQLGGTMKIEGDYPGWEYKKDSKLRDRMIEVFKEQYGREPKVEAIHAGLECGIFVGKMPGLDCISLGPDLKEVHTVGEHLNIPSVQRVYAFVLEILKRMKA